MSTRLLSAVCLALVACGGHAVEEKTTPDAGPPPFVAVQGDFADYATWESFDGGTNANDGLDGGVRTLYLNHRPPSGSKVFPIGTIIVKTTDGAQTVAMVKRGGSFNNHGAINWEWFELANAASGDVQIVWRGTGDDLMVTYGDTTPTSCNQCHFNGGIFNDFVAGEALQLSSF